MKTKLIALLLLMILGPGIAMGGPFLTGNWNGARQRAHDAGIDFFGSYATDFAANPIGGQSQGWTCPGSFDAAVSFNLEKISRIGGCSLYNSISWRYGNSLSSEYIDNEFPVQQVYGGQTFHLAELYLQESLFDQSLTIKLGRLCGGNDFLASPIYLRYVTDAININPISIVYNAFFSTYPFATWGAYLDFQIGSYLFKFGAYNTNVSIWKNKFHGANFTFDSQQGLFLITEWAYLFKSLHGLKGHYKIGGYTITGQNDHRTNGSVPSNYGMYFLFDQMFYVHDLRTDQGLTGWGAFLYAPADRNEFPFFFALGLVDEGLIQSRPHDALCLAVAYGHYSSQLNNSEVLHLRQKLFGPLDLRSKGAETQIELNYWLQATPWFALTPVVQYIINPKGYGTIKNAFVTGIQIELDL
ncbi:MAG: carbohydrate-selective porin, OprB family [Parachlamydiales bacterium]|nr:carbohydrate-selective porin, OprB family [Parachlamydiales bacterium]